MSRAPTDESTLTTLQELVEAWSDEDYASVITHCSSLLKKRKSLEPNVGDSMQRLLLQAYIQGKQYAKVTEWAQTTANSNINNSKSTSGHRDLVLYAQYRLEDYDQVSKEVSNDSTLEQHLRAQSHFHMNQVNPALKVYQKLLQDSAIEEDSKMELLTNALAVMSSSTVVPYVSLPYSTTSGVVEDAESFLEEHPEYSDLALNLGTLNFLTDPFGKKNWLEEAKEACDDPGDMVPIDINLAWSRHFWPDNMDEVQYNTTKGTAAQIAIAKLNKALLDHKALPSQPHAKWNALQVQMYWHNRAVQQYQSNQLVECQESCQSLRKILGAGGKKKNANAQPSSSAEWWWASRTDVILAHVLQEQSKTQVAITKLQQQVQGLKKQPASDIIDNALAYVQVHLHSLQHPSSSKDATCALLKSLPASIQSQPAVVATLEVLGVATGKAKSKTGKASTPAEQADSCFTQGKYEEAAKLYEENLPVPSKCNEEQLALHLKRVQALAMDGQHDASQQVFETLLPLLDSMASPLGSNGEALETQALPRSNKASHLVAASNVDEKSQQSKESVLRQRARKREVYLKILEEKGDYNPDRPTKPNAERWTPKHERSRGGRRRGQNTRSAQGGGSQADAQRLDAAARRAGIIPSSAGPSTANMKVSSGGRKGGRRR